MRRLLPGLGLLAALAGVATLVAGFVPGVNALLLGVVLGAVVGNLVGVPERVRPGVDTQKLLLETGIVLLGARIAIDELVASGPVVLGLVLATVVSGVLFVELISGRVFGLGDDAGSVLAAGASVCGVSAATAIAGIIDADGESLAHVVAAILLFDAITLFAFPIVGAVLPLTSRQFGVWAGLSMFSTGPVTAAGFAHSAVAGQWATVTKLARNSLLGVVALWYAVRFADGDAAGVRGALDGLPRFLVGFALVAAAANAGVLSGDVLEAVNAVSDGLFALAFVGLGLEVRIEAMRETGAAPVLVLAVQLITVSLASLVAVVALL